MNLEISYAGFGVKPPVTKPIQEFLLEVGEDGLRELISKHYDAIKGSDIYPLFPQDDAVCNRCKSERTLAGTL